MNIFCFVFRVCEEDEEDLPLHQRLQRSAPSFYPEKFDEEIEIREDVPIDEFVFDVFRKKKQKKIVKSTFVLDIGVRRTSFKLNTVFK